MNFNVLLVSIFIFFHSAAALRLQAAQAKRSSSQPTTHFRVVSPTASAAQGQNNELDLGTVQDLIYLTNITIAGTSYTVQLDTGSSDLWVKGATSPLPNTKESSISYNLTYGIGWAFGHVAYTTVEFAGINVPSQAFLDVSKVYNPALGYGAEGILGLGFTSLSTVDALVNATGASTGRSLLYNLFLDNPSEPNFIAISLQRSSDAASSVEGTFSIGEYEPAYADVANQPQIPTWPVNSPKRWNVLVDAVLMGNQVVTPTSVVTGAPSNKAVALLDSGTSYTYAPKAICDAIYSQVAGATFDADLGQWVVPCGTEIDIALQLGGQIYPVHPLDVLPNSLTDATTCVGSFVPGSVAVGAGEFDWLIGDNFLRSVYSVYDFGDFDSNNVMGNPYVRLLSLVNPDKASQEFVAVRGGTAKTGITYNAANDTTGTTVPGAIGTSSDISDTLNKVATYLPIMLAVMGLNALVVIILIVVGVVLLCRRRRKSTSRTRNPQGRISPAVPHPHNSYIAGSTRSTSEPQYQPVSMAITDDTLFGPPSPGFRKFDGERPKSTATRPASSLYQEVGSEDAIFSSPAAAGPSPVKRASIMSAARLAPEDQPFTPPAVVLDGMPTVPVDKVSIRSGRSSRQSPSDERQSTEENGELQTPMESIPLLQQVPVPITPDASIVALQPEMLSDSPIEMRPVSILKPSTGTPLNDPSAPMSEQSDAPIANKSLQGALLRPLLLSTSPTEIRSAPPMPPPFRRPIGVSLADRPMSAVILPSQSQYQHPSIPRPSRSSLRPNPSMAPRPMSANVAATMDLPEEDITSIPPRAPFLRRSPLSKSAMDRPSSMA